MDDFIFSRLCPLSCQVFSKAGKKWLKWELQGLVAAPGGDTGVTLPWSLSLGGTAESGNAGVPGLPNHRSRGDKSEQQGMCFLEQNQLSDGLSEVSFKLFSSFSAHMQQRSVALESHHTKVVTQTQLGIFLLVQVFSQLCQKGFAPSCARSRQCP